MQLLKQIKENLKYTYLINRLDVFCLDQILKSFI